jgi:outer membrane protein OmpA-like peptidoglycan-associated protein
MDPLKRHEKAWIFSCIYPFIGIFLKKLYFAFQTTKNMKNTYSVSGWMLSLLIAFPLFFGSAFAQEGKFAVQLAAYDQKVPMSMFQGIDKVFEVKAYGFMYKYYVDNFMSQSDAEAVKNKAVGMGFKHARVIDLEEKMRKSTNCCYAFNEEIITPEPGETISLRNVFFDFDKSALRSDGIAELDKLVTLMRAHPDYIVEIHAHTDAKGSNEYNIALSERRKNAVIAYLKKHNISESRIQGKVYGEAEPIAVNEMPGGKDSPAGRQYNRRVELTVKAGNTDTGVVEKIQVPDELKTK